MASRALLPLLFLALSGFAQDPAELLEKAPPELDAALRARINKFYQLHVEGKFREAFDLVAEDSKDPFFAAEKTKYLSFSILKIDYSENFTKAKAVVACNSDIGMFGTRFKVNVPIASLWKLVDGQWYWYIVPTNEFVTPFGVMKPGPMPKEENPSDSVLNAPRVAALKQMVKVDKTEVHLSASEPASDRVTVSNHLPGVVTLALECPEFPGLEIKLDRRELKQGETATIFFHSSPIDKAPRPDVIATLRVAQINQTFPIRVMFSSPRRP